MSAAAQSENINGQHASDWTLSAAIADDAKGTAYLKKLGIPGFDVGTNSITNDMVAMVHAGEEITPRPFVDLQRAARDMTNDLLSRLLASHGEMRAELALIRQSSAETSTNTRETADSTDEFNNLQLQVVKGGMSYQTREAGTEL